MSGLVISGLLAESKSSDYRRRIAAGQELARHAGTREADAQLVRLLLDREDTAVTVWVADALLRRHDVVGLLLVARALCQADDQTTDWLLSAFHDEFLQSYEDLALAESLLRTRGRIS